MSYRLKTGDAFLLRDDAEDFELHVVLFGADIPQDLVYMVKVAPVNEVNEQVCVLSIGDHPCIEEESAVFYKIRLVQQSDLARWRARGLMRSAVPVSEGVLIRIRQGYFQAKYRTDRIDALLTDTAA